jgi:serpin B
MTCDRLGGGLTEVDFTKPGPVCDLINVWAEQKTGGRIKQIVSPGSITPLTRFILTNAVYFKGQWAEPFEVPQTKTAPFLSEGASTLVPMMQQVASCRFGNFKVLEKPYRGGEIAMMILLPDYPQAMPELEQSLSAEKVKEWSSKLDLQKVDISMPKFELQTSMPLTPALRSLGMARVFDHRQADLSGINDGKEPLWLDWVEQQANVDVDEEGTRAAAITTSFGGGAIEARPRVFRADHPFIFLIRDTRTGCIFFMGRLVKPALH